MSGETEKESLLQPQTQQTTTNATTTTAGTIPSYPAIKEEEKKQDIENQNNNNVEQTNEEQKPLSPNEYKAGVAFGVLNCIAGVFLVLGAIRFQICAWFRGVAGVCITYLALRDDGCEQYCLKWFPLWDDGNLLFIGLLFLFLGCSAVDLLMANSWKDTSTWNQILIVLHCYVMILGAIYVILFPIQKYLNAPIPNALPIMELCQSLVKKATGSEEKTETDASKQQPPQQQQQQQQQPSKPAEAGAGGGGAQEPKVVEAKAVAIEEKENIVVASKPVKAADAKPKVVESKPEVVEVKPPKPKVIESKPQIIEAKPKVIEPKVVESQPQIIEAKPQIINDNK